MDELLSPFILKRFWSQGIFEARNSSIIKIIIQTLVVSMLLANPLAMSLFKTDIAANELPSYIIAVYIGVIFLNIIFLLLLSIISKFANAASAISLTVRQFFAFYAYAATIPGLLAVIVGLAVNIIMIYFIYNFGLLILVYLIYQSEQKKARRVY